MDDKNNNVNPIDDPQFFSAVHPTRDLKRPKIHFWAVPLYIAAHLATAWLIAFAVGGCVRRSAGGALAYAFTFGWAFALAAFALTLRFTLIWAVKVYQHYAKDEVRLRCFMVPSCSEYAILALRKYGAIVGAIKAWKRLKRCHPPGGVDYP